MLTVLLALTLAPQFVRGAAPDLWLYESTNLQVDKNVDSLEKLWRRAASAGLGMKGRSQQRASAQQRGRKGSRADHRYILVLGGEKGARMAAGPCAPRPIRS